MKLPYDPDLLKFPIGPFKAEAFTEELKTVSIDKIRKLPFRLQEITSEIKKEQYQWCYRPEGWSIQQVIHHLADSHMNAFLRLKWALFEDTPTIKGYDEAAWAQSADVSNAPVIASI